MSETATSDDAALNAGPGRRWIWAFHLIAVAVAGAVLWSLSYPGSHFFLLAAGGLAAFAVGSFWLAWTIAVAITTRRGRLWFLIGPAIGVLTLMLLGTDAPLKTRWAASRDAFGAVVAGHPIPPPGSKWEQFTVPRRLGSYTITSADWVPGGAVFYEAHGSGFIDDAGFAYLPGGPTTELDTGLFEGPSFRHLGGGWYSWTASW